MAYRAAVGYRGCCGFMEIYDFDEGESVRGKTPEEFLTNLKARYSPGQLFHIWFNDYSGDDDDEDYSEGFVWPAMMDAVSKIPDVIDLGQHRNPNSGNNIHGYMWVNKKD